MSSEKSVKICQKLPEKLTRHDSTLPTMDYGDLWLFRVNFQFQMAYNKLTVPLVL